MSLSIDGVWKAGVWAETVWADGVWREGLPSLDSKSRNINYASKQSRRSSVNSTNRISKVRAKRQRITYER